MAEDKIFPTILSEKNDYYNSVIPYADTEKARLLIDGTKIGDQVTNLGNWNIAYPKSISDNLSTKTIRQERDNLDAAMETGMREIYNDIPESLLTDADRNTFHLKKRDTNPTPRAAITVTPFANAQGKAGALVEFICRTASDSSRASILPEADGAEVVYNVGGTQPVNPSDCNRNFFSTKAKFRIGFEPGDAGKKVNGFIRWKNTSDPAKSGPWKAISTMITE